MQNRFEFFDTLRTRIHEELTNPPKGVSLPWWPRFNELMGGLRPHELTVLTAPTGAGKTTITANFACQSLIEAQGIYVCSAEIGNVMFGLAMYGAFDKKDWIAGDKWSIDEVRALQARWEHVMRAAPLVFSRNDDRIEPRELIAEVTEAHDNFGCKLVILDNLQFFMPIGAPGQQLAMTDEAIRDFVRFIRRTDVHVILIAHPRKSQGGTGQIASEESVKGSSSIFQECSNFIGFNRLSPEQLQLPGFTRYDRELKFFKIRRRGRNVGKSVFFEYDGGRYVEKNVNYGAWK